MHEMEFRRNTTLAPSYEGWWYGRRHHPDGDGGIYPYEIARAPIDGRLIVLTPTRQYVDYAELTEFYWYGPVPKVVQGSAT